MSSGSDAGGRSQGGVDELAASIYVELLGRAAPRMENNTVIKPDAAALAALSFKLAEVFRVAQKEAHAATDPKNVGYDVQAADITGWKK